jgi:two-component system KDP operon response regulator KdpE
MSQKMDRILIVDDELPIRKFLRVSLEGNGYEVLETETGKQALELVNTHNPAGIVLDLGLPDMSGLEVTKAIRQTSQVPIIILSVQGQEKVKIEALDLGADDYLTKPFSLEELLARLRRTLLRSKSVSNPTLYTVGEIRLDLERRHANIRGKDLGLTPNEFGLLATLMRQCGKVLTHKQLLKEVWGEAYADDSHLLRVNICNLRRKLEVEKDVPNYIKTEPGVGYRLLDPS